MPYALTVLYREPGNLEGFESHYEQNHLPLVRALPGLRSVRVSRYTRTPTGGDPAYHLAVAMIFDDEDALNAALRSEENRAVYEDFKEMADEYGTSADMVVGEEEEIA